MLHWINRDLWGPIWPNLAASAICTGAVWWRARIHLRRVRDEHAARHEVAHRLLTEMHQRMNAAGFEQAPGTAEETD